MRRARDNPFAVHRVLRERYRLGDVEWTALLARLQSLGWCGAIVGPHGSGKTTLLEDLAVRLEAFGARVHWLRLSAEMKRLTATATWGREDFILCDGAEQLSFIDWQRLRFRAARAGGLVITTHVENRLPVVYRCEASAALLRELVESLGEWISDAECEALFARHQGNLRDALRELYDHWSTPAGRP